MGTIRLCSNYCCSVMGVLWYNSGINFSNGCGPIPVLIDTLTWLYIKFDSRHRIESKDSSFGAITWDYVGKLVFLRFDREHT